MRIAQRANRNLRVDVAVRTQGIAPQCGIESNHFHKLRYCNSGWQDFRSAKDKRATSMRKPSKARKAARKTKASPGKRSPKKRSLKKTSRKKAAAKKTAAKKSPVKKTTRKKKAATKTASRKAKAIGKRVAAATGCCTLTGSGPDEQREGLTKEQCRRLAMRKGKNYQWIAGLCAESGRR